MKHCPICKQEYIADVKVCDCIEINRAKPGTASDRYIGTVVDGRFKVLARVALGRMGTVYLAEQSDNQKKVALKILDPRYAADAEYVKEFCQSVRLASGLKHPNIATILDFDQTADGCLFVATDYVEGEPLDRVVEDAGRLEVGRAIHFAEQIGDGLAAAHRRGLLHKDIRPCNIMVTADSQIKVTDCGVPRPHEKSSSKRLANTDTGTTSPEYTAPEQVSGTELSEQTDIYQFGVVLYEMLTGQVPFREPTHLSTLLAQINDTPRPLRQLRREIPEGLEALVMQCLEKRPAKRPVSMARLTKDLRACAKAWEEAAKVPVQMHTPIAVPTQSPTMAASATRQSVRWKVASAAALGLAAFIGYLGFFWESVPVASVPASSIAQPRAPQAPQREVVPPVGEPLANSVSEVVTAGPTDHEAPKEKPAVAPAPAKVAEAKPLVLAAKPAAPLIVNLEPLAPEKKIVEIAKPAEPKPVSQALPAASLPAPPQVPPQAPQVAARVDDKELARLHNQIEQRLRSQGLLKVSDSDRWGVTVEANANGVVTLRGALRDQKLRDEAIRAARDNAGVTEVRTNISLQFAPEGN